MGYFLNNSLAEKPDDFRQYLNLVYDYIYLEQKVIDDKKLMESVNVCVANLPDLIIDYPNAKLYASEIISKSVSYNLMTQEDADKYIKHIDNLDSWLI